MNTSKMKNVLSRFNISENIFKLSNRVNSKDDFRLRVDDKMLIEKSDGEVWNEVGSIDKGLEDVGKWDDLRYPAVGISLLGVTDPPDVQQDTGFFLFGGSPDIDTIVVTSQMPHALKENSFLRPHVHWSKTSDVAGDVYWTLRYKLFKFGEIESPWSDIVTAVDALPVDATQKHMISSFPEIDTSDFSISQLILFQIGRLGPAPEDTYPDDARFFEFDIHVLRDSFGSFEEFNK